ncbi:YrdB family protein [Frondihabitans sp. PAMC 28766]|uniref:YrdB family protein n=1 Tax=Frondihabitans sp. PAMC 28766 TaxID=1795630 RepID=UPI0009E6784C|nr:YrdB family protein [Frondihabitans sp. PAMC 28766]
MFDTPKRRPGRGGGGNGQPLRAGDVLRFFLELFAFFSLAFWGYMAWPFPLPGIFFTLGLPIFAIVIWGLFRSPKAVIKSDPVGRAIVEIAIMGAAVYTWFSLGYPVVGVVFGVLALVSGILNFRRENAS